jgi:microtubule-associated protein-like 6
VHGYRSGDCRNNLYFSAAGAVVFPAAAVGVVYSKSLGKQMFLQGAHTDEIISLAAHPSSQIFASGEIGRIPSIVVWNSTDLHIIRRIDGVHKRGVPLLAFNAKGNLLASMGLDKDNTIAVHDWTNGVEIMRTQTSINNVYCFCFVYSLDDTNGVMEECLVTGGDCHLEFWRFSGKNIKSQHGLWGKESHSTILCLSSCTPNVCVCGCINGQLFIWDGFKVRKCFIVWIKKYIYALVYKYRYIFLY